jgi:chemotaxis protein methyltransferase CheR
MTTWSSPALAAVADLVQATTGLTFPEARVKDVESTIHRVMARRGLSDATELVDVLRRDDVERETLVADLTIGETYFQRDPAQFEVRRPHSAGTAAPSRTAGPPAPRLERRLRVGRGAVQRRHAVRRAGCAGQRADHRHRHFPASDCRTRSAASTPGGLSVPRQMTSVQRYFRERGRYFELQPADSRACGLPLPEPGRGHVPLAERRHLGHGRDPVPQRAHLLRPPDRSSAWRGACIASLSEDGWLILGASDPRIAELVECDVVLTDAGLIYRRPCAAGREVLDDLAAGAGEPGPAA